MKSLIPAVLAALLLVAVPAAGLDIASVYPDPAVVGSPVTVIGGPFAPPLTVIIGGREIVPQLVDERQLVFIVPPLEAGEHALYLRGDRQQSQQTVSLRVSLPLPQISTLEPSNVDACSTPEQRMITLRGAHFRAGAQLLLNGQIVPSTRLSDTEINFTVPPLEAGTYGVEVINPDGGASLPHSLWFNNIPHIYDVSRGEDFVSSYQLIISGINFVHNSALIVYEYPVGLIDLPPQQRIVPGQGGPAFRGEQARQQASEAVIYIDCNTLIYNRHPYSRQDKTLILRVGNPDGKQTEPYELITP
jgi:hypothetical protein